MTLLSYTIEKIINFLDMSEKLLIFSTVPFFERNLKCLKGENVYRFGRIEAVKVVMALQFSTILVLFLKPIVRTREKFYAFQNATFVLIFALFFQAHTRQLPRRCGSCGRSRKIHAGHAPRHAHRLTGQCVRPDHRPKQLAGLADTRLHVSTRWTQPARALIS